MCKRPTGFNWATNSCPATSTTRCSTSETAKTGTYAASPYAGAIVELARQNLRQKLMILTLNGSWCMVHVSKIWFIQVFLYDFGPFFQKIDSPTHFNRWIPTPAGPNTSQQLRSNKKGSNNIESATGSIQNTSKAKESSE